MDTLEFLQRVLPSEGFYVSTTINGPEPKDRRQGFFDTADQLAKVCVQLDRTKNNTYFAVASFKDRKGGRKQTNVHSLKAVWFDVDCGEGKPYASQQDGVQALGTFILAAKLPRPMIVSSGRGIHVYWVFDRDLSPNEWQPIATALKASAIANGFKVDAGLTGDSARVMRPVGTRNPKNGKVVKILLDAPPVNVEQFILALGSVAQPIAQPVRSALLDSLEVKQEFPPAVAHVLKSKCQQIDWAVDNQDKVPEPMWYSLIGIAAHCVDPEETAKAWSSKHPKYDEDATIKKLEQWRKSTTGPATCHKIEQDNPGGCKGCKFKGNITTPVRLGVQYKEIPPPPEAANETANLIKLPRPFKRTADGIKATIDDTDIDVCPFDIIPQSYGKDEGLGYETVRYLWNRPHVGWSKLVLRQAYLAEGSREFASAIADQGIVLYNKRQTEYFQLMTRSYMEQLRKARTMTNLYSTMGWKEDHTQFVMGDIAIKKQDGVVTEEEISLASGATRLGSELYGAAGSLQAWSSMTNVIEKAYMPWFMFSLGVGFSAPLYDFTGLKGLTVSLYGPTGGGKTLAQLWVQSIYGNPDKLHFAAKFTQNTLFNRLGLYCHMPMTIDEVTMMEDKDVGDFCYWVSQGRDKARLNRSAEERDARTWAAPVLVSTNKSFQSKLTASGLDTDAQMARLLEVNVPVHKLFTTGTDAGRKIYQFLTTNYGYVGREFMKRLVDIGEDGIKAMIADATDTFAKRYNCQFNGTERYWEQAIILADLASKLAKDWGLINYDYSMGTKWVLEQIGAMRKTAVDNRMDAFDIIATFLNDHADVAVTVMHTDKATPVPDFARMPRESIRARFDLYRKTAQAPFDRGTLMLDRSHFRKWLSSKGHDYRVFILELTAEGVIATPKSQKYYLGRDTPIKIGQTYVVGVNLNHPRLQGILNDADASTADNSTLGAALELFPQETDMENVKCALALMDWATKILNEVGKLPVPVRKAMTMAAYNMIHEARALTLAAAESQGLLKDGDGEETRKAKS